jgi:hypothetical protein
MRLDLIGLGFCVICLAHGANLSSLWAVMRLFDSKSNPASAQHFAGCVIASPNVCCCAFLFFVVKVFHIFHFEISKFLPTGAQG